MMTGGKGRDRRRRAWSSACRPISRRQSSAIIPQASVTALAPILPLGRRSRRMSLLSSVWYCSLVPCPWYRRTQVSALQFRLVHQQSSSSSGMRSGCSFRSDRRRKDSPDRVQEERVGGEVLHVRVVVHPQGGQADVAQDDPAVRDAPVLRALEAERVKTPQAGALAQKPADRANSGDGGDGFVSLCYTNHGNLAGEWLMCFRQYT